MQKHILNIIGLSIIVASTAVAQSTSTLSSQDLSGRINTITTAVPFLLIGPDARHGAMGEVGAATPADATSIHWNTAKLAFAEKKASASISITPWLKQLVPDIYLYHVAGYGKLSKTQTLGASLRYFSLGNITFTDIVGNTTGQFRPNEFSLDVAYAQKLSETFSAGLAMRYIRSNLTGNYTLSNGQPSKPGTSFAVDLGFYYQSKKIDLSGKKAFASGGLVISNMGSKVSYSTQKDFIPMNLRLGGGLKILLDEFNSFGIYADANKLLVPTPPVYLKTTAGSDSVSSSTGEKIIIAGKDNRDVGIAAGMVQSFGDAPGGANEELKEINYSVGVEYWYGSPRVFAVRAGYFNESKTKGNRKFFTAGIGVRYSKFGLDMSYLIPVTQRNPLQNTLRFTLTFDFGDEGGKSEAAKPTE